VAVSKEAEVLRKLYQDWTDRMAAAPDLSIANLRSMFDEWGQPALEPENVCYKSDHVGGVEAIWALPVGADTTRVVLYTHGGGFAVGSADSHRKMAGHLAKALGVTACILHYRRAPEHPFPAQLEDAVAAYQALLAKGQEPAKIMTAGDSAGGNLAAVVALHARDHAGPKLTKQVLIYPATEFAMTHPSHQRFAEGLLLTRPTMEWFRDHYLRGPGDIADWRASPLRAASFAGLPPALVLIAGCDPLSDEGEDYANRLRAAGVPVTLKRFEGLIHGFLTMGKLIPAADEAVADIAGALRAAFVR